MGKENYTGHRIEPTGVVIVTEEGTEVTIPLDSAKSVFKDLRRHLGDFHDHSDDRRDHYPANDIKYGQAL